VSTAEWEAKALCRIAAYKPYFADRFPLGMTRGQQTKAAKDVCRRCKALDDCREWIEAQEGTTPASFRAGVVAARTARERARDAGAAIDEPDDDAAAEGSIDEDGAA
jgi:hypothetical protein